MHVSAVSLGEFGLAPPRFAVAGVSLGGYVAMEFCRRFEACVRALVLACNPRSFVQR